MIVQLMIFLIAFQKDQMPYDNDNDQKPYDNDNDLWEAEIPK